MTASAAAPSCPVDDPHGVEVFCSWSGGKDSALSLHEAVTAGALPRLLVTMMTEAGDRSRSHGLSRKVMQAQADAVGVPMRFGCASWATYEPEFRSLVAGAVAEGIGVGVFGDIDLDDHREWAQTVCDRAGASAWHPLWRWERAAVVERVLEAGFEPVIVAVKDGVLPESLLGRVIDDGVIAVFEQSGVDLAGEQGEYHTVVVDGPIFHHPVDVVAGERSLRDGVWYVDLQLA